MDNLGFFTRKIESDLDFWDVWHPPHVCVLKKVHDGADIFVGDYVA